MNTPASSIRPGQPWLDTQGKRIQAHGGSVMYLDGTYYWYGENKEKTDGKNGIWHWGVRCYASTDLYNWEDKGLIIPPEPKDPNSSLHPSASMDRPHILYNQRTKKFVCWLKIMNRDKTQTETVLTADHILGPYTKVREATAHFCRKGKHYLVTSGTTGYLPNPSEVAIADTWHGPYTVLGDPHPTDPSHTSFHSQISSVFQVVGKKDLYIAVADRWCPQNMDVPYDFTREMFEYLFQGRREEIPALAERYGIQRPAGDRERDTSIADYVWLPFRFEGDRPYLDWHDEWRIEDYE
jgi:hypothetical protein